ncbi:glycosyltransferase family 2 protein [Alsobacter soli]|uniref:Glycosyltransferase family 2 protein n=1 Tax=Alsobacter soli TaxID=2109933 RepID=A0A2T1HNA7_9HYPH|nr:glycosyltransferase family 2 protein [Alsobacter soli]PSC03113.1 glycosyltransferase family 2 protein [Alsobacter soli]
MTLFNSPVTIVMPALNEERYIETAVRTLLSGVGDLDFELLVMDGGSTDRTAEVVDRLAREEPRIRLVHNPKRLQSAAVNLGARIAAPRSKVLVRADCHAAYPPGFLRRCVAALEETGAASVVVPMLTQGRTWFQRAAAAAQNSLLGNGGSAHRRAGESGFVEHGHHAAFLRQAFLDLGGYDESFTHNEDAEFDHRLTRSGRRIWLAADLAIHYFPRADLKGLARQYFNHGAGRARTATKHRTPLKIRQLAPLVVSLTVVLGLALGVLLHPIFLAPVAFYAGLCLSWGLATALRTGDGTVAGMGIAAMVMHLAWACGFASQIIRE